MSNQPTNIHDAFFKKVLSDPQAANTFLREHLPPELTALLAPELPELLPGSFVDEILGQHHSDLLFRIKLTSGSSALAYLLMEHKSAPHRATRLQLLRYIVRILTRWYDEHDRLPLPPVLPLVAHHGPNGWTFSAEFSDLFGEVPGPLRPYLVSFRHALVDFALIEDNALSAQIRLRAFLKTLKYILRPDLPERFEALLAEGRELQIVDVVQILAYIGKGPVSVSDEVLHQALQRILPDQAEEIMASFGHQYFEAGIAVGEARGEAIGEARGKTQGEAQALVRLLEKRFGAVSPELRTRIFAADQASIEAWLDRVIDARELTSVFGPN